MGGGRYPLASNGYAVFLRTRFFATPSWVQPGTSCCKIHPSAGRTREEKLMDEKIFFIDVLRRLTGVICFRVRGDWRSRWSAMLPGPVVGLGHVTQPNNIGPWQPEAEGRDRKENRPLVGTRHAVSLQGGTPNLEFLSLSPL